MDVTNRDRNAARWDTRARELDSFRIRAADQEHLTLIRNFIFFNENIG